MKSVCLFLLVISFTLTTFAEILSNRQIEKLKSTMLDSIQRKNSNYTITEFNGSFDWHSDVHAHWALLSIARLTKDAELENYMLSLLTLERLESEMRFLMAKPWETFEKPYGRAWMLLLLWELGQRKIGQTKRFKDIRTILTRDMLKWLRSTPFPENSSTQGLIGTHESWLMSLFLFNLAKGDDEQLAQHVNYLISNRLLPLKQQIEEKQFETHDFLYLPALKHLITPDQVYDKEPLPFLTGSFSCHYPGAIQASLWAHAFQCSRGDRNSCRKTREINNQFLQNKNLWKNDFDCVSHWVPQFVWMTHWLSLGRP